MAQQCLPSPSHGIGTGTGTVTGKGTGPRQRRPWWSRSEASVPPGFTFNPKDEQLIIHYLRIYAAGQTLRWDHVVEAGVYSTEPWDLLGADRDVGYFFAKRTRHRTRVNRTAGRGTWTGQTKKEQIISSRGEVIGFKAMFSFCIGRGGVVVGGGGDCDDCSQKPPKKTTGYVMYEYELPSTVKGRAAKGPQAELQEPVLCCIKKSAQEIARSHKRKRVDVTEAACIHLATKRARHPGISEVGLGCDDHNSTSSRILAAAESATPDYADSATFTDAALAVLGIPACLHAADYNSAPPTYRPAGATPEGGAADAINLVCNGPLEMTMAVDRQQHCGEGTGTTIAAIFEGRECGRNSTIREFAESVTLTDGSLADVGIPTCVCAADYCTVPPPAMTSSEEEMTEDAVNLVRHGLLGMTTDISQQLSPYHHGWTVMMNSDIFYGLGGDMNAGDSESSTAVIRAGDCRPPPLPYEFTSTTAPAPTVDQRLLSSHPDQDKQMVADEAGSLDQLLAVLTREGFSDWFDSLLKADPSLPPLNDSNMLFRNCRMPPTASSSGAAASAWTEGQESMRKAA